jgi:hypothetical protein
MQYSERPLAQDSTGAFLSLPAIENADWGYARSKRCVLMVPSAEWVQSVYSCTFTLNGKEFTAPNRDYPYEGLAVHQDGENWKFIDCIALALQHHDGNPIPFVIDTFSPTVQINPWKVTYCYKILDAPAGGSKSKEIPFFVSYYLNSNNTPKLATGCVELYFPQGLVFEGGGIRPIIQPFVDIRHMYESNDSIEGYHKWDEIRGNRKQIHVTHYNRRLTFYVSQVISEFFSTPEVLVWKYKLGQGTRTERPNPDGRKSETLFEEKERRVVSFFNFQVPDNCEQRFIRLLWGCGLNDEPAKYVLPHVERFFKESRQRDQAQFQQIREACPLPADLAFRSAIWARILGLLKFKIYIRRPGTQDYLVPPAGAWWFKTLWTRDAFEGILNSLETLLKFPEEQEAVKGVILLALHDQDKHSGRILRGIPEYKHLETFYDSSDGTLLCFIVANAYIQKTRDLDFALKVLPHAWTTIRCFYEDNVKASDLFQIDGPPRVDGESGLLLSAPRHSWIDTRSQSVNHRGQEIGGLPSRFSEQFIRDLWDHLNDQIPDKKKLEDLLFAPNFFLPEINAQWITLLRGTIETIDFVASQASQPPVITDLQDRQTDLQGLKGIAQEILDRAHKSFERTFWNEENGFLFNTLYEDRAVKDKLECEAGVTAAAMLGETVFTRQKLVSIWECARDKLLIHRRLVQYGEETLPFGLITRNVRHGAYYGDAQYHGDVTWPRSTPYLIKLLQLLDEDKVIKEILINTLDHQVSEAAIFYNQELFSKPVGNNPHPDERTRNNPVPVKNSVQFWSQWCDAFIEFFGERKG